MRERTERSWKALARELPDAGAWRALAGERVHLADEIVRDVLDYVVSTDSYSPRNFALIARGGIGRGFLSEGSDVDMTLLFADDIPTEAHSFWARFEQSLTDVIGATRCLQVSPLATTIAACTDEWSRVFADNDTVRLSSYVSFTYTRCIAGNAVLHDQLRDAWKRVAVSTRAGEADTVVRQLNNRRGHVKLNQAASTFHLKDDAGGVLEFRLIGFVEQFLSCRGIPFAPDSLELVKVHEFFLILRDQLFRSTRTPFLLYSDLPQLCPAIGKVTGRVLSPERLWNEITRHRIRVRAEYKAAVDALANAMAGESDEAH